MVSSSYMTDLSTAIRSFMTCFCVCESWEKASIGIQGFMTADREQTKCMSMYVVSV